MIIPTVIPNAYRCDDPLLIRLLGAGVSGSNPVITGTPFPGETLTSTIAGQWTVGGVDQAETGTTYVVKVADIGLPIRCANSNTLTGINSPTIAAFIAASGATVTTAQSNLELYLRQQNLLTSSRFFPEKSAQNAGSGSTLYGWGGLTSNDGTLVNSPSWGSGGISLNGTNQYIEIADFLDSSTLTVFSRVDISGSLSSNGCIASQFETATNDRSWHLSYAHLAGYLNILRSSNGEVSGREIYQNTTDPRGADRCFVAQWVASGGRSLWINKTAQSLSLTTGSAQNNRYNSNLPIRIGCLFITGSPTDFLPATLVAHLFIVGNLTLAQREAITDLINAL
jgi:hypothetical protein